MKKILIPLAIFFVLAIGAAIFFVSGYFEALNNRTEIAEYMAKAIEAGSLRAGVDGKSIPLDAGHADRLLGYLSLGPTLRTRDWAEPSGYKDRVTLYMGDMTLTVYALDGEPQTDVMEKDVGGQKRWSRLEKYNILQWVKKIVEG